MVKVEFLPKDGALPPRRLLPGTDLKWKTAMPTPRNRNINVIILGKIQHFIQK
jgi:hypothetical protein